MPDTGTPDTSAPGTSAPGTGTNGNDIALDDPHVLAEACIALPRPWLVGLDVDGTLAPIVARPEMARLAPHALAAVSGLARSIGVMVAVVSGRPLTDLRHRFELPTDVILLGSHGAEVGSEVDGRTTEENQAIARTIDELDRVVAVLPGAWIEHKPLAVALHVRQSDPDAARRALAELEVVLSGHDDVTIHRGHMVLEIAVRASSKAPAFAQLRRRLEPATSYFIGDDASDEHVFASLGDTDVSVKVGGGPTAARHRLAAPTDVVTFLLGLGAQLSTSER